MPTGELYPQPRDAGDVVTAWRELANHLLTQAKQVEHGVEAGRRAGASYAVTVGALDVEANRITDALSGAAPGGEQAQLVGAIGNGAGVGLELGRALGKANDPNTEPGDIDFEAANRAAGYEADGITRDANALRGYPEPPDDSGGHEPI